MSIETISSSRGLGVWQFEIYNPNKILGGFKGYLYIAKDHHIVFEDAKMTKTIINIPSQNVA